MRKTLLWVLVLCLLLLCGCGEQAQTPNAPGNTPDAPGLEPPATESGPAYAMVLHVKINPAFALYLDAEGNILSAEAENEDAQTLLATLDISGKPYADGMTAILDTAYTQGYLKDGGKVSVAVDVVGETGFELNTVFEPVSRFKEEKGLTTETSLEILTAEVPDSESETAVLDGQTVYVYRNSLTGEDGKIRGMYTVYASKKVGFFQDPMDYAVKVIYQGNDGETRVEHYQNGVVTQSLATLADGTIQKFTYFLSGNKKTVSVLHPNGDYQNEWWYENGNPKRIEYLHENVYSDMEFAENGATLRSKGKNPDGSSAETFYDENGTYIGYSRYEPDGDYEIYTCYPDGKRKSMEYLTDGTYCKSEYDTNDHLTYYNDGTLECFFSGGKLIKVVENGVTYTDPDTLRNYAAGFGIIDQDENNEGKNPDGSSIEAFYDENGNYIGYSRYEPDGDYEIGTLYPDGKTKSVEFLTDGVYCKSEYDSNGNLTYQKYSDNEINNEAFFSGGKLVKFVENGVTYTDPETLRQRAAGFGITQ